MAVIRRHYDWRANGQRLQYAQIEIALSIAIDYIIATIDEILRAGAEANINYEVVVIFLAIPNQY
jgi:hypothetical protein